MTTSKIWLGLGLLQRESARRSQRWHQNISVDKSVGQDRLARSHQVSFFYPLWQAPLQRKHPLPECKWRRAWATMSEMKSFHFGVMGGRRCKSTRGTTRCHRRLPAEPRWQTERWECTRKPSNNICSHSKPAQCTQDRKNRCGQYYHPFHFTLNVIFIGCFPFFNRMYYFLFSLLSSEAQPVKVYQFLLRFPPAKIERLLFSFIKYMKQCNWLDFSEYIWAAFNWIGISLYAWIDPNYIWSEIEHTRGYYLDPFAL